MTDEAIKESITNIYATLDGRPDLSLCEVSIYGLWSMQSSEAIKLGAFSTLVFNQKSELGTMLKVDGLRLIQLWPDKAYMLSNQFQFPREALYFEAIATDISHGWCELMLSGDQSLIFLNAYTTADLEHKSIATDCCIRTRLGHYPVILWWDCSSDIHILVDRSYAQSMVVYLNTLSTRWD